MQQQQSKLLEPPLNWCIPTKTAPFSLCCLLAQHKDNVQAICSGKFYTIYWKLQPVLLMRGGFSSLLGLCGSLRDGCSLSPCYPPSTGSDAPYSAAHVSSNRRSTALSMPSFKTPHEQQRDRALRAARMLPLEIQEFCVDKNEAMILPNCLLKPPLHLDFLKRALDHIFPWQRQANLFLNPVLFYIRGS